jgi:hypothetical protein
LKNNFLYKGLPIASGKGNEVHTLFQRA